MKTGPRHRLLAAALVLIGLAFAAGGIYVGETDDAPGAALLGFLLMIGAIVLGITIGRRAPTPNLQN